VDFVVVGFGIGSVCILAGLVLRDAPGWWTRCPRRQPPTDDALRAARLCRALGNVLLVCGLALALVTLAALFTGLSDSVGALLVASAVTVVAIGVAAWAYRWRRRFPPPRRQMAAAALVAAPAPLAVAIEQALALERAAATENEETIEASGLTVERTVMAEECREIPEPTAGEHEAAEERQLARRHGDIADRAEEAASAAAAMAERSGDADHGGPGGAPPGVDADGAPRATRHDEADAAAPLHSAAPEPAAHGDAHAGSMDKPRGSS
jgi:hypothetical protein